MTKAVAKGVGAGTAITTSSSTTAGTPGWTKNVSAISAATDQNQEIDGVLSGVKWNTIDGTDWTRLTGTANGTISFSFPDTWTDYGRTYGSSEHRKNFRSFDKEQEQNAFYSVLAGIGLVATENTAASFEYISAVTPLRFEEFGEYDQSNDASAILRFARTDMKNAEAWAYYPSSNPTGGDAWFSNQYINFNNLDVGTYDYTVLMHELGHTLGLKHSFEKTSYGTVPVDSLSYTVMSYSSYPGADNWYGGTAYDFPQTLMMYDIAALQHMYGANFTTANVGHTTYTWNPDNNRLEIKEGATTRFFDPGEEILENEDGTVEDLGKVYQTLWDGNGNDTYNLAAFTSNLTIDLRPGEWVNFNNDQLADIDGTNGNLLAPGNVANALLFEGNLQSLIENAIGGTGSDTIIANRAVNELTGGKNVNDVAGYLAGDNFEWKDLGDLLNSTTAGSRAAWDAILDFQVGVDEIDIQIAGVNEAASTYSRGQVILWSDFADRGGVEVGRINVAADKGFDVGLWFFDVA